MVPAFDQAAFALKPGEISDVVTTAVRLSHHQADREEGRGRRCPFEQVKPQVVEYLSNQKKQQRVDSFIDEAKKRAKIEVLV